MIDNQSIAVHTFASRILMSLSVDETLLPKYMNLSTNFREPSFRVEMFPFLLKLLYSAFTRRPMPPDFSRDSIWIDVFVRSAMSSPLSASALV